MHDGVDRFGREDGVERCRIAIVGLDQPALRRHRRGVPFLEVVDDDDPVAAGERPLDDDGADIAGSARDEQRHAVRAVAP